VIITKFYTKSVEALQMSVEKIEHELIEYPIRSIKIAVVTGSFDLYLHETFTEVFKVLPNSDKTLPLTSRTLFKLSPEVGYYLFETVAEWKMVETANQTSVYTVTIDLGDKISAV
jgi:hypothetical protein